MRYILHFKGNEPTKRVSQKIGEGAIKAKLAGGNVEIKGALYDTVMISKIIPINRDHFSSEFVKAEQRKELANEEERAYLQSTGSLPKLTDGKE